MKLITCYYLSRKFTVELLITLFISQCILGSLNGCKWNLYCRLNIDKIRRRNKFFVSFRAPNWPREQEHQFTQVSLVVTSTSWSSLIPHDNLQGSHQESLEFLSKTFKKSASSTLVKGFVLLKEL